MPSATVDPSELFDVDVDQFARPLSLVAHRGLEPQPPELAHPDLGENPRHRGDGHAERLSDLWTGEPQSSERSDRLDALLPNAMRDPMRS
jgi:hypothetical protein